MSKGESQDKPEEGRAVSGVFLPGNRLWEARRTCGAPRMFETPDELWEACLKYFEWIEENPLHEAKLVSFQGVSKQETLQKPRVMTLHSLCIFLNIHRSTWNEWRDSRADLKDVIELVDDIITENKFAGAAADIFNPAIIARDLGLADKQDLTSSDGSLVTRSKDEILAEIADLKKKLGV